MDLYFVTGTTHGIGAAMRDVLATRAATRLVCLSRAPETVAPIGNVHVDLAEVDALRPAFQRALDMAGAGTFERAVLINNAGVVQPVARAEELDAREVARHLNVNLVAPLALGGWFVRSFAARAASVLVVNVSSGAARRPVAGWSAYCAGKAGLEMGTRVAAVEAAPNVAICSLAPGVVDTPMQGVVRSADARAFPDRARFEALKSDGVLRAADEVARDIVAAIESGKLANGGNFDLREMGS
jgi:benzil reductase ((S)-benzoin forming)